MSFILDLQLHPNQQIIYDDPHRFKVIAAGRQFGKTRLVTRAAGGIALTKKDSIGMVVAPYAKQAYKDWREILRFIPQQYLEDKSAKWMTFSLKNKSEIMMGSAENIDGLRGYTLDWAIVDEAAYCDQEVWEVLEPALGKQKGQGFFISTPNGKGWFWDLYNRMGNDSQFQSFHFTTYDNPTFPVSEIERMKANMPELMFRQEVMAEFLEGGIVFPHLKELMTSSPREPVPGHNYVTGADIASTNDFTVIRTFDASDNHEVNFVRLTNRDWSFIRGTIYAVCKRYNNAWLFIDKTGVGAPVVEDLEKMDCQYPRAVKQGRLRVVPIVFSSVSKPQLYSNYIMMQENHMIHFLPEPVMEKEHQDFTMTRGQGTTGYMKYGAPKGRHDDTVTAGALAGWGLNEYGTVSMVGPYTQDQFDKEKKKQIDPAHQLDIDTIILKNESRQISGFATEEDQNINVNYE
jgi:hypothetical protein